MTLGNSRDTSSPNEGRVWTPRAYQGRIARWSLDESPDGRGMLAVDLGLGKTASSLMVVQASLWDRFDTSRWLVVAPKLVAQDTWPTQLQTWGEFKHLDWRLLTAREFNLTQGVVMGRGDDEQVVHAGAVALLESEGWKRLAKSGLLFRDKASVKRGLRELREHVHIVSWDFLPFLVQAWGASWPYDGVILDESTFAQNSTGLRHKAVWHVVQRLKRVSRVIELSGLPTPNGRQAMHGQIRLLDGGARLGKGKGEFEERWMVPDRMDKRTGRVWSWKLNPMLVQSFDAALRDIVVSLRSEDYLSLPPVVMNDVMVRLPMPARAAYAALERDLVATLDDGMSEVVAASQGVLVGKLLQVCSGACYTSTRSKQWSSVHDEKIDKIAELVEAATEPLIVVYQFQHEYERLRKRIPSIRDVTERDVLRDFKAGKLMVMCGHPASFGHGVDGLQHVCHQLVWFGATYNLEHWVQVLKRLQRDGQERPVIVTRLLVEDSLEPDVAHVVLADKREGSDLMLQAVRLRASAASIA